MNRIAAAWLTSSLLLAGVAASAQDAMTQDAMAGEAMHHDSMKKDASSHTAMNEAMHHDSMKKKASSHATMKKDMMKKGSMHTMHQGAGDSMHGMATMEHKPMAKDEGSSSQSLPMP